MNYVFSLVVEQLFCFSGCTAFPAHIQIELTNFLCLFLTFLIGTVTTADLHLKKLPKTRLVQVDGNRLLVNGIPVLDCR